MANIKTNKRFSKQRQAILDYLSTSDSHPTAETIYTDLKAEIPNLSLGTVYRNLALLHNEKVIEKVDIHNAEARYDADTNLHYHCICERCGSVIDLYPQNIDVITPLLESIPRFKANNHSINIYGLCGVCDNKP